MPIMAEKRTFLTSSKDLNSLRTKNNIERHDSMSISIKKDREGNVLQVAAGQIIKRFDKTPAPREPTDIVCPHFLELKWANGCYFDCAWCYLNGTYRFHPEWKNGSPNIKDFDLIKGHLEAFLNNGSKPEILNSGELSDSLVCESDKRSFSKFIIPIFDLQKKHKILFLTKGTNVKNILDLNMPNRVILSWTMNAQPVAQRWEKKAPRVEQRIKAAMECYKQGYEIRVRIDPMVPIHNWEKHYRELLDNMFSEFVPERITLGSLRGLTTTINKCKDKSWVPFMKETSNWGKKIDLQTRLKMYRTVIDYLSDNHDFRNVAICKETLEVHQKLGIDYKDLKCNCVI